MSRSKALLAALLSLDCVALLWRFQREIVLHRNLTDVWTQWFQAFVTANWLAFGLGQTFISASGALPASMIAVMAGATLGIAKGLALSAASTMLGGWLAFALSRSALRNRIARHLQRYPTIARLDDAISNEGWRMVALLRVSPVMPFALTSYGIGLTRISNRDFLLGTGASLPALAGYVALGALGEQGLLMANGGLADWRLLFLVAGAAAVSYAVARVNRTFKDLLAV